jgi:D-alanyl-D-alanine dipeptidase
VSDRFDVRLARAAASAGEAGLAGLLVTPGPDLGYLTGYTPLPLERLTLLVLAPERAPVLLVPALERPEALDSPAGERMEVVAWTDGEDPYAAAARLLGPGTFAIGDQTWATHVLGLQATVRGLALVPSSAALPLLRAVKDEEELRCLAKAARGADAAYREITASTFEGRREADVAAELGERLRDHGHETVDFTIVGSGPNSASPHHDPGERTIRPGDLVVLDFGGHASGYCSDITRTVVVGEPAVDQLEVHAVVAAAQQAGFDVVGPGVPAGDVDRAARRVIEEAGFGASFPHRTGHGIGIEVHEPPYIVEGSAMALEPGMTFSVEPGVYLAGRFGVRIEDIVAVTSDGGIRLNRAPRDLAVVA